MPHFHKNIINRRWSPATYSSVIEHSLGISGAIVGKKEHDRNNFNNVEHCAELNKPDVSRSSVQNSLPIVTGKMMFCFNSKSFLVRLHPLEYDCDLLNQGIVPTMQLDSDTFQYCRHGSQDTGVLQHGDVIPRPANQVRK